LRQSGINGAIIHKPNHFLEKLGDAVLYFFFTSLKRKESTMDIAWNQFTILTQICDLILGKNKERRCGTSHGRIRKIRKMGLRKMGADGYKVTLKS
jgi:hypothetical protein